MGPGQFAVQLGTWVGVQNGFAEGQLGLRVDVPLSERISAFAMSGIQRTFDGALEPRDSVVGASWLAIRQDNVVLRLAPGLNFPTGGLGQGLYFTPLSTSSFDPWLAGDLLVGGAWLVGTSFVVKAPLYAGWDRRVQGPFARFDVLGARRLKNWVPSAGVSIARQAPARPAGSAPDFSDLAATVGTVVNLGDRWSAGARLRVPVWASADGQPVPAGGMSVRSVIGKRIVKEQQ